MSIFKTYKLIANLQYYFQVKFIACEKRHRYLIFVIDDALDNTLQSKLLALEVYLSQNSIDSVQI